MENCLTCETKSLSNLCFVAADTVVGEENGGITVVGEGNGDTTTETNGEIVS